MNRSFRAAPALVALCVATASPVAMAQAQAWQLTCSNFGAAAPEPFGDRPGHSLQVSDATCTIAGGPMDGGVTTQHAAWELDGNHGRLVISMPTARRPDGRLVSVSSVGALDMQVQDGRPTGWTATGKGNFVVASGKGAVLAGKAYHWSARATTPGVYAIEVKTE